MCVKNTNYNGCDNGVWSPLTILHGEWTEPTMEVSSNLMNLSNFAENAALDVNTRHVEYQCIMDVFTLSSLSAQVRVICVNNIKGSCPK